MTLYNIPMCSLEPTMCLNAVSGLSELVQTTTVQMVNDWRRWSCVSLVLTLRASHLLSPVQWMTISVIEKEFWFQRSFRWLPGCSLSFVGSSLAGAEALTVQEEELSICGPTLTCCGRWYRQECLHVVWSWCLKSTRLGGAFHCFHGNNHGNSVQRVSLLLPWKHWSSGASDCFHGNVALSESGG